MLVSLGTVIQYAKVQLLFISIKYFSENIFVTYAILYNPIH